MAKRQPANNRSQSHAETRDTLVRASHRLSRHYSSFLAGDIGAEDDLAAILRTLVYDDVLGRAIKRFRLESPTLVVSPQANGDTSTLFSVGAFLTPRGYGSLPEGVAETMTFDQWRSCLCLVVEGVGPLHRVFTWSTFINTMANTWGSHAAPTIPPALDETRMHTFGERSIDSFLLRNAAIVAGLVLISVLAQLGLSDAAGPVPEQQSEPVTLASLRVHDLGLQAEVRTIPGLRTGTPPGEYSIVDVPLRNQGRIAISFHIDA